MLMLMVTVTYSIMERVCATTCVYIYLLLLCECLLTTAKDEIFAIRLSYPSDPDIHYKGKVKIQINYEPVWYDICYDGSDDADQPSWNRAAATVACRQLGFQAGWNGSRHGISSEFTFEGFVCTNYSAGSLNDCTYDDKEWQGCSVSDFNFYHFDQAQAFIECYNLEDTTIRLQPLDTTSEPHSGKLEAMYRGAWYDVCYRGTSRSYDHDDWNIRNANVACYQLGYSLGAVQSSMFTSKPYMRRRLSFDEFRCNGDEDNLFSCFPDPPNESECGDGNQVFIVCKEPESTTLDIDHGSTQEHVIETVATMHPVTTIPSSTSDATTTSDDQKLDNYNEVLAIAISVPIIGSIIIGVTVCLLYFKCKSGSKSTTDTPPPENPESAYTGLNPSTMSSTAYETYDYLNNGAEEMVDVPRCNNVPSLTENLDQTYADVDPPTSMISGYSTYLSLDDNATTDTNTPRTNVPSPTENPDSTYDNVDPPLKNKSTVNAPRSKVPIPPPVEFDTHGGDVATAYYANIT